MKLINYHKRTILKLGTLKCQTHHHTD